MALEGRLLDIEIARRLFGINKVYGRDGQPWDAEKHDHINCFFIPSGKPWRTHHIDAAYLPMYSSDMAHAIHVAERFWSVLIDGCEGVSPRYTVTITARGLSQQWTAQADTAAEAICRAALEAVT